MDLPFATLALMVVVGAATGWLARHVASEPGFGPIGDSVAGLVGAFAGVGLARKLGMGADVATVAVVGTALVGAAIAVAGARHLAEVWASQVSPRADAEGRPLPPPETPAAAAHAPRCAPSEPADEGEKPLPWYYRNR
ncbi:GlsB/YeaQ/YmgE family stress response membrane protein [Rhodoplanes azumiensis]|uniref:GlsB/YeaQ/YmgE family stress response membrane protein n=1 Tax=Rhodoplanes azumiensis TaxID=1897628 RepID=A0ABW5AKL9_9BRAD